MKNTVLIVLALILSMNITGCSLFTSSDEDAETATVAEDGTAKDEFSEEGGDDFESGDFDSEAMAKGEGEISDAFGSDVEVEDTFADDYSDDDYGAGAATATASSDASDDFIDDNSFGSDDSSDALYADVGGLPSDTMSSNQEDDLFAMDSSEPVVDTPTFTDSSFSSEPVFDVPMAPNYVPVKKMKTSVYNRAGANINRLYVVRSGDNMEAIAQKLYGDSSKVNDLYSYNSHFKGKTINVGDKIYYESPNNPNDQSMMTYYEDNNIPPSYYTSRQGDNIRKVSKQLLGHNRSWMEVYATNANVDSKGKLSSGLQLRYWPEGGAAPVIAMNDAPPTMETDDTMSIPPAAEVAPESEEPKDMMAESVEDIPDFEEPDINIDEPKDMAMNEPSMDDPKMDDPAMAAPPAMGQVNNTPPPPQPVAPPPPPTPIPKSNLRKPGPPRVKIDSPSDDPLAAIGNDSVILVGLGALLILAAFIMIIFIRRSRAKRVDFSQTQV